MYVMHVCMYACMCFYNLYIHTYIHILLIAYMYMLHVLVVDKPQ